TGEKIPVIGMGTWNLSNDIKNEVEALKFGIKKGMRFIDTAEMYGTEEIVGEAIKDEDNVFVATKVSPEHFRYNDVIKACNASLKRLGIKQIDLYQLHWPNKFVPIEETMRAMEKLVKEGKIRYIGVSNFSVEETIAAQNALKKNEIVSNQVEYSLLARDIERDLLPFCEKEKITVIAYSPFAQGHLFDKKYSKLHYELEKIAKKYNKTMAQVTLNWLISKKPVVAIPKASDIKHIEENAGAVGWKLRKEDFEKIDEISKKFFRHFWL
ncbi:MAG: aldo/keto reductase, partial [Candidatus Aenigmatarchaeota archaeon]